MSILSRPSKAEALIETQLRSRALNEIRKQGLSVKELAAKLEIFPAAAQQLLKEEVWTLQEALRACEALGISVQLRQ
jgi:plasmid maintenance system antidote protein VapI